VGKQVSGKHCERTADSSVYASNKPAVNEATNVLPTGWIFWNQV